MFLTLFIPLMLLFAVFMKFQNNNFTNELYFYSEKQLVYVRNILDTYFDSINAHSSLLFADQNTSLYLNNSSNIQPFLSERTLDIYKQLQSYYNTSNFLSSIYFYSPLNNYVISTSTHTNADIRVFPDKNWLGPATEQDKILFTRTAAVDKKTYECLTYCKKQYYKNNIEAIALYNIDIAPLLSLLCAQCDSNLDIYLFDSSGVSVFKTAEPSEDIAEAVSVAENTRFYTVIQNKNNIVSAVNLNTVPFTLVTKAAPSNSLRQQMQNNRNFLVFLVFVIIILSVALSFNLTNRFYKSILNIINIMQNPNVYVAENNKKLSGEFNYIVQNIVSASKRNSQIEADLTEKLSELKDAQTIALQSQISPHFLYNTLQAVSSTATRILKEENPISTIVSHLADLLRYTINSTEYLVDLETELEIAKKYLELQNIKYGNTITVEQNISEDALDLKIVKFILQPILENAIMHGHSETSNGILLSIDAKTENNFLIITVTDNGSGIPPEKLKEVRSAMNDYSMRKANKFGLFNINRRIKIICGDAYGCFIDSKNNKTSVTLKLPIIARGIIDV